MRENKSQIITTKEKQSGDFPVLFVEFLAIQKTIAIAIQRKLQWIIIRNDPQLVINSISDKICLYKYIINLVKDVEILSLSFKDIIVENRGRLN